MSLPAGAVHIVTGDGTKFVLNESNTMLVFSAAYGCGAFINGNDDEVVLNWRGPLGGNNDRVADNGQGTTFLVGRGIYPELPEFKSLPYQTERIWNFAHDKTGTINVLSPFYHFGSDGHGGTNIYYLDGQADVIGVPHLSAAQVHLV